MLRRLHDASAGFAAADPVWQLPAHAPAEVVCHNDFAPHNLVFRGGMPVGVIDWDTASPGPRAWDLAHLAYRLVPLTAAGHPETPASSRADRAARLRALCDAYAAAGPVAGCRPGDVLALGEQRVRELAAFTAARARRERSAELDSHVALYRADAAYLRAEAARGPGRGPAAAGR
jgi:aminoglycoside phosphotransferase (APT) family kinase protein